MEKKLHYFKNLAGIEDNQLLKEELEQAGITVCDDFYEHIYKNSELKNPKYYGNVKINNPRNSWSFTRLWTYWVAKGYAGIPYKYALELYREPDDIRILGGCGHPDQLAGFSPTSYHIDTHEGLKLFADTLKKIKTEFTKE